MELEEKNFLNIICDNKMKIKDKLIKQKEYIKSIYDKKKLIIYITKIILIFFTLFVFPYLYKLKGKEKTNILLTNYELEQRVDNFVQTLPKIKKYETFEFRNINSQNILLKDTLNIINNNKKPAVSVILTLSNQAHCIHKALRSIQNQSLKNIEIIVSIDCSYDNSTEVIKSYMKKDKRIILIEHDTIEGTMKNRNDGIRKAKGKYITIVDGDDALIHRNILKNAFEIASLGNIDIVEFYGYMYKNNVTKNIINYHKNVNGIIRQPELKSIFFNINENNTYFAFNSRVIWGKLIKAEVLEKTLEKLGPKYTDDYMLVYEDALITITLYQIAQSLYFFNEPGYYYSRDEFSGRFPFSSNKQCKIGGKTNHGEDSLKYLTYIYDMLEDNYFFRRVICHEIIGINNFNYLKFSKNIIDHFDMFYRVINGLLSTNYLTKIERKKLNEIKEEVKNKEKSLKK